MNVDFAFEIDQRVRHKLTGEEGFVRALQLERQGVKMVLIIPQYDSTRLLCWPQDLVESAEPEAEDTAATAE